MSDDDIGLIQALGLVAWADDRLADEEKEMLDTVMNALGIPPATRTTLCRAFREAPPTVEAIAASFSDDTERRFAIAQAIMMAQADGVVSPEERDKITRLAQALGIADDELQMLYAAVSLTGDLTSGDLPED